MHSLVDQMRLAVYKSKCRMRRTDTYNPNKTKYWNERRTTASMEQAHRTEVIDRTSMEAEADMDANGENILIRDGLHSFDLDEFSCGVPSGASSSTGTPLAGGG